MLQSNFWYLERVSCLECQYWGHRVHHGAQLRMPIALGSNVSTDTTMPSPAGQFPFFFLTIFTNQLACLTFKLLLTIDAPVNWVSFDGTSSNSEITASSRSCPWIDQSSTSCTVSETLEPGFHRLPSLAMDLEMITPVPNISRFCARFPPREANIFIKYIKIKRPSDCDYTNVHKCGYI